MSISNQLLLFLDVVQQGSFTKAASLHGMDNSSLSKQIKKLEQSLDVQLLNRSTRSFSLTSAGEEILEQSQMLRDTLGHIQLIADSYQAKPKGVLRITSPIYFGQEYLQPVITQFMTTYPDVKVLHSLDDKKADIIADQFDIAFRLGKLTESNLIAKKVANTHFVLVASNSFIEKHGEPSTPSDLIHLPAIIYGNYDLTIEELSINDAPESKVYTNLKMKGNYQVSDVRTMVNAVRDGLGYALIDLSNLNKPIEELGLKVLLSEHHISTRNTAIYAVYPHRKHTKLAQEFIKAVVEYIGTPPLWHSYLNK
ncbi:LysR family transcriptional regulator [Vibrio kyushuensis]|uniref:LysR family transcriptional regulator n=1 Tax=Vibrio kyushuensis TaxID=2910249 RepID=UPI003D0D2439